MLTRVIALLAVAFAILIAWGLGTAQGPAKRPTAPSGGSGGFPRHTVPNPTLAPIADSRSSTAARNRVDRNAAPPRRIRIPAIGADAHVVALGLHRNGTLQTPRRWEQAGWYKPGPEPGERGPAVIVGHVDSKTGPAVFYRLRRLKPGNVISITRSDHSVVRFRVQRIRRWPKSEFPTSLVYGPTSGAALRLVTCSGNFNPSTGHYVDNTIVFASRV
jgi:sortase (surface protein transpeptidase)